MGLVPISFFLFDFMSKLQRFYSHNIFSNCNDMHTLRSFESEGVAYLKEEKNRVKKNLGFSIGFSLLLKERERKRKALIKQPSTHIQLCKFTRILFEYFK